MSFIQAIISKIIPKKSFNPLGRWKIEHCDIKIKNKIDLSNEDHCGPCGQYALTKIVSENNKVNCHATNSSSDKLYNTTLAYPVVNIKK
jgi:hypothetical protein